MAREGKRGILFLKAWAEETVLEELWLFLPRSYPHPWVQEEEEGSAFFLWENQEPKGAPRAHEAPKALRQRQQAKELLWLWAR